MRVRVQLGSDTVVISSWHDWHASISEEARRFLEPPELLELLPGDLMLLVLCSKTCGDTIQPNLRDSGIGRTKCRGYQGCWIASIDSGHWDFLEEIVPIERRSLKLDFLVGIHSFRLNRVEMEMRRVRFPCKKGRSRSIAQQAKISGATAAANLKLYSININSTLPFIKARINHFNLLWCVIHISPGSNL